MDNLYPEGATWKAVDRNKNIAVIRLVKVERVDGRRYETWYYVYQVADGSVSHSGIEYSYLACYRKIGIEARFRRVWSNKEIKELP